MIAPLSCDDFTFNVRGDWNGSYLPGNYTGYLDYTFNAYSRTNSIRIIADNGVTLLNSNGYISGEYSGRFYYSNANHGRLHLQVFASQITGDGWDLSITCP